jgi:glycosyltransferase involved in cell wall biosynthesis
MRLIYSLRDAFILWGQFLKGKQMELTDLTVVVPTRNEAHNIVAFLDSLPHAVQVIVVDSSDDDTPARIKTHRPGNTRVIRRMANIPQARQLGAEATDTPWLLFTDADIIFPTDYFYKLSAINDDGAVYGPKLSNGAFAAYYRWQSRGQQLSHRMGVPAVSGSNFLVRRHVFFAVGGFDEQLICNEDSELGWRIKRQGYRITFAPDLVVYARDHRRLDRGATRKTVHSMVRCGLLYFNFMPSRWRSGDWGYWQNRPDPTAIGKSETR